jgi:hypothetical protein
MYGNNRYDLLCCLLFAVAIGLADESISRGDTLEGSV